MSHGCILLPIFDTTLPLLLLEKWELELAVTPKDDIYLDLFIKFLNRQVVCKEAGERGLHKNTNPNNRSSNKGRNESKKSVTRIQVTVNEYQLLLLCSVRHNHR